MLNQIQRNKFSKKKKKNQRNNWRRQKFSTRKCAVKYKKELKKIRNFKEKPVAGKSARICKLSRWKVTIFLAMKHIQPQWESTNQNATILVVTASKFQNPQLSKCGKVIP